jgi:hypothetical protein
MHARKLRQNNRGGVLLDLVLAAALIILGAFALDLMGITFQSIIQGAEQFFGL